MRDSPAQCSRKRQWELKVRVLAMGVAGVFAQLSCAHRQDSHSGAIVKKLKLDGVSQVSRSRLEASIATTATGWWWPFAQKHYYDPFIWQSDLRRIERVYEARGFYQAEVRSDEVKNVKGGVELRAVISEGRPTRIAAVDIQGLEDVDAT